jgi:hypothetical protein
MAANDLEDFLIVAPISAKQRLQPLATHGLPSGQTTPHQLTNPN